MILKIVQGRFLALLLVAFFTTANTTIPIIEPHFFSKNISLLKTKVIAEYTQVAAVNFPTASINIGAESYGFNAFVKESIATINGDIEGPIAMGGDLNLIGSITVTGNSRGDFKVAGAVSYTHLTLPTTPYV